MKIMVFADAETKTHKFHSHNSPVLIDYVDTNKIKVSNKVFFFDKKGFKYLIGYEDNDKVNPYL